METTTQHTAVGIQQPPFAIQQPPVAIQQPPVVIQQPPVAIQQPAIVIQQQPTAVVTNPKLLGSVQGVRDWSAGLCGCCSDCKAMLKTCCCLTCSLCELSVRTGECFLMPFLVPGGLMALRTSIRRLGGIKGSICIDCMVMSCFPTLAICQMLHEVDEMGL